MPGLRWTRWGAVALPETLQVRLSPFADRVRAGAPEATRGLDDEELRANLAHFVEPGPRGRPIGALVVSGLPQAERIGPLADAVRWARARTVRRVVVHVERPRLAEVVASPLIGAVDTLVVAVRAPQTLEPAPGAELHAVIPLEDAPSRQLPEILAALASGPRPARVVLTWPFPGAGAPPPAVQELVPRIHAALPALEGLSWGLKGVPACALTAVLPREALEARVWRSANRWYVDAAHQLDRALLFLPEVVRYAKREACRFCAFDPRCDGVADAWLAEGRVGPLVPLIDRAPGDRGDLERA